jgi:hypothetical protein
MDRIRKFIKICPGVTDALQKKKTTVYRMINDGRLPRQPLPGVLDVEEFAEAQERLLAARDANEAA